MKRLLSATVSLFTSVAVLSCGSIIPAGAESVSVSEEYTFENFYDYSANVSDSVQVLSNFSDDSYIFRDYLDKNNLAVYDALSSLVTPSEKQITVTLPESVSVQLKSSSDISELSEEDAETFNSAIASAFKTGIDALLLDVPELFWLDESKLSIGTSYSTSYNWFTGGYTVTLKKLIFTPHYLESYGSIDGVKEYAEKLSEAVDSFNVEGETQYEKIKSIHDGISVFTHYDVNADFYNSAVGALVEPGVVCEGYSKAFKLLCDRENIPCICVLGNYEEENRVAHMWNYVKMEDGNWYGVDVTWDDVDGSGGREVKYDYFLKGSDSFNQKHSDKTGYFGTFLTYPTISADDYVWNGSQQETTSSTTITTETTTTTATTATETAFEQTSLPAETSATTVTKPVTTAVTEQTDIYTETSQTTSKKTKPSKTTASSTVTNTTETAPIQTTTTTTNFEFVMEVEGDTNEDGYLSMADLVYCANALYGKVEITNECDVNMDGKFNIYDMTALRKLIVSNMYILF